MTIAEQRTLLAEQAWEQNSELNMQLVERVFRSNPLPPLFASLQSVAAFLTSLQKESFKLGFIVCLRSSEESLNDSAATNWSAVLPKASPWQLIRLTICWVLLSFVGGIILPLGCREGDEIACVLMKLAKSSPDEEQDLF